jgi:hypothetical protein
MYYCILQIQQDPNTSLISNKLSLFIVQKNVVYKNDVRILSQPVFDNYEICLTCTVMRPHVPQLKTALLLPYHTDILKNF